jgi:hypothetical protein
LLCSWGDDSSDDEDLNAPPVVEDDPSSSESESDDDDDDDDAAVEVPAAVEPVKEEKVEPVKQLSKKELKKKELEELDALLEAELGAVAVAGALVLRVCFGVGTLICEGYDGGVWCLAMKTLRISLTRGLFVVKRQ